jgi:hypothetical protein
MPQYECPFRRHDVARVHLRHHGTAQGGDTDPRQQHHSDSPLYPAFGLREEPRYFSYLPLSHIAERQIVEYSSLFACGEVNFNESLETLLRDLQRTRPHMFFGPPRIWEQFQQAVIAKFGGQEALENALAEDAAGIGKLVLDTMGLGEVEYCLTAAAPTPPPLIHWWEKLGLTLMEGFRADRGHGPDRQRPRFAAYRLHRQADRRGRIQDHG